MAIEFRCNRCNKLLRVDESSAGKKARCPECSNIQDVPYTSTTGGGAAADYPYYGGPTPPARPGAVPMSAPSSSVGTPPNPQPPSAAPTSPGPTYTSAGSPFASQPTGGYNPYSEQATANPYATSQPVYSPVSPAERTQRARARVKPPAIVLMGVSLIFLAVGALFLFGMLAAMSDHEEDAAIGCAILGVMCGIAGVVPIVSGMLMFSMRAYGLCMAGIIVSMIISLMTCLPLIAVSIWALVVLLDPDVRAAFR